jgi:predicted peptidase
MGKIMAGVGVLLFSVSLVSAGTSKEKLYEPLVFSNDKGEMLPYRMLRPANYDASKKYPLVVFYHGAGERGDDNTNQLRNCATYFIKPDVMEKFPAFVVFPQCPWRQRWVEVDWDRDASAQPAEPGQALRLSVELIERLLKQYSIDDRRIYLSGISMGGFAVWDLITRYPDMFAAAVPICGGGDETKAARCVHMPVWAFHSADDWGVKVIRSRNMIDAIRKAGGDPRYTEYRGLGHFSWNKAYSESELFPWMFGQFRQTQFAAQPPRKPEDVQAHSGG